MLRVCSCALPREEQQGAGVESRRCYCCSHALCRAAMAPAPAGGREGTDLWGDEGSATLKRDFQQPPLQGLVWPTFIHLWPDSGMSHLMGREFWCCAGELGQKPPDPHLIALRVSSDSPGAGCVQPWGEHGQPTVQAQLKPSLESCALFGSGNLMTTSAHIQSLGS